MGFRRAIKSLHLWESVVYFCIFFPPGKEGSELSLDFSKGSLNPLRRLRTVSLKKRVDLSYGRQPLHVPGLACVFLLSRCQERDQELRPKVQQGPAYAGKDWMARGTAQHALDRLPDATHGHFNMHSPGMGKYSHGWALDVVIIQLEY